MTVPESDVGYHWQPITRLPNSLSSLGDDALQGWAAAWREQKDSLPQKELEEFFERLQRYWSIETGIIERAYSISDGTTRVLVERGLSAAYMPDSEVDRSPADIVRVLKDHKSVIEGLTDFVGMQRHLSVSYIKELHAALMRHQETADAVDQFGRSVSLRLAKGEFKDRPNNPVREDGLIHEYCPPEQVASEMDNLVAWYAEYEGRVNPEVLAAWLHHRFAQIHPFQDGNGRVARALASLVLLRADWFPLIVRRDERASYIECLEVADGGDLEPLVRFVAGTQRREMKRALNIAVDVEERSRELGQVIEALADSLRTRNQEASIVLDRSRELANSMIDVGHQRLDDLRERLVNDIVPLLKSSDAWTDKHLYEPESDKNRYYSIQVFRAAADDHFANLEAYHSWAKCAVRSGTRRVEILLSLHALGKTWRGTIVGSLIVTSVDTASESGQQIERVEAVLEDDFVLSSEEDRASVEGRFSRWIEEGLIVGTARLGELI